MSIGYEEQAIIRSSIGFAALTFLLYDHLITLAEEVTYIWAHPKHASAILFFVNRYLGCFLAVTQTVMLFVIMSPEVCIQYTHYRRVLIFMNQAIVCTLFIIRTYALYGGNKRLLAFLLFTSLALASPVAWSLARQQGTSATNIPGCQMIYNTNTATHLAIPPEALCIFDTLIFVLTVYKTFKVGIRSNAHSKPNLVMLLLRDGAIYFVIVAMVNLANILTFFVAPELLRGGLTIVSICIAITMVSRLMLNLHKTADAGIFSYRKHLTSSAIFTTQFLDSEEGWDLPTVMD
ncbi:hypothetical protein BKA82DRAFT_1000230 [Pisolithus tinctorius]|nr:hypothetical protein BKA82DRAFT_1000230 [Pisolithus tinctorius]